MKKFRKCINNKYGIISRLLFSFNHKWQTRGRNIYGFATYQVCLKCGKAQEWEGGLNGRFVDCKRNPFLDEQFDENNNYIFNDY